jgi:hypothetical protein
MPAPQSGRHQSYKLVKSANAAVLPRLLIVFQVLQNGHLQVYHLLWEVRLEFLVIRKVCFRSTLLESFVGYYRSSQ